MISDFFWQGNSAGATPADGEMQIHAVMLSTCMHACQCIDIAESIEL